MKVNKEEIEEYLNRWQDILRLRDWDIVIKIVKTRWRKSGDIKIEMWGDVGTVLDFVTFVFKRDCEPYTVRYRARNDPIRACGKDEILYWENRDTLLRSNSPPALKLRWI